MEAEKIELRSTLVRAEELIRNLRSEHQHSVDGLVADARAELTALKQDNQELRVVVCFEKYPFFLYSAKRDFTIACMCSQAPDSMFVSLSDKP